MHLPLPRRSAPVLALCLGLLFGLPLQALSSPQSTITRATPTPKPSITATPTPTPTPTSVPTPAPIGPPPAPDAATVSAARFLEQASFGPTPADLTLVKISARQPGLTSN